MKNRGFTIAETLITMTIVGLVAAMTIPTLVASYQKKVWSTSLSVAVSSLEKAMTAMIVKESADGLLETKAWREGSEADLGQHSTEADKLTFVANLGKTFPLEYDENKSSASDYYESNTIKSINGEDLYDVSTKDPMQRMLPLTSKHGATYFIYIDHRTLGHGIHKTEEELLKLNVNLSTIAAEVVIDVNGMKKPNTIGRDIFYYYLGTNGKLYPIGGFDYAVMYDNGLTWDDNSSTHACTDSQKSDYGWGCTARITENKFVMDY